MPIAVRRWSVGFACNLPPAEQAERLEQLRALHYGMQVGVARIERPRATGRRHPRGSSPREDAVARTEGEPMTSAARSTTKYIFVTGGVVSSLGKGIAAASLGRLLVERGLSVTMQKFDPYINVDPGTMSPFQHGEVYVTDDGAETDLDLGHYERYIDRSLSQQNNITTGRIYQTRHRQGTPRRIPRLHGAGHSPHHRRDQERHPAHRAGSGRGDHRDRRHGRRHRIVAVPRGHPPVPSGESVGTTPCSCT